MSEPDSPAPPRRAALVFVFVTVVLDMLALGMIVPVLPKLVESFMGGDTASHPWALSAALATAAGGPSKLCRVQHSSDVRR